jgi:predicted ABC-type ATPase
MPQVIVLAGPNGAGKSTAVAHLLPRGIEYVNADEIAKTLLNYPSKEADIAAGRLVLGRLDALQAARSDFSVERTLAGRSLAARIADQRRVGYHFRLIFLWTPNPEFSIRRVAARVRAGGHHIPEETIRRRYSAGIANFFGLYRPSPISGRSSTRPGFDRRRSPKVRWTTWSRSSTPRFGRGCSRRWAMRDEGEGILGNWDATGSEIRDAMEVAVRKALLEHKRAGRSVVVWDRENDRIVELKAEQIDVEEDTSEPVARPNGVKARGPVAPSE